MFWDPTSQTIAGYYSGYMNDNANGASNLTNTVTGVDLTSSEVILANATGTSLVFSVTGKFGTGNASNTAFVDVFEVVSL
jgi:hypothetical protein